MKKIFSCRRSSLCLLGLVMMTGISILAILKNQPQVAVAFALPMAGAIGAVGAANAYEKKGATNVD